MLAVIFGPAIQTTAAPNPRWSSPLSIGTDNGGDVQNPQVVMDSRGNAVAVWSQSNGSRYDVYANRYVSGAGWGNVSVVETDDAGDAREVQVAVDSTGQVVAVWSQHDGTQYNIYANRYTDGAGWTSATLLETEDFGPAHSPQIAVDRAGNAVVMWAQTAGWPVNIWANRYVAGMGWGAATLIETGASPAYSPQVAVDSAGNAIAVWSQHDGVSDTIYANRFVIGRGWETARSIGTGGAFAPQVAMDPQGNAIAVWHQWDTSALVPVTSVYSSRHSVGSGWENATKIEEDDWGGVSPPQIAVDAAGNGIAVWRQADATGGRVWTNQYRAGAGWGAANRIDTNPLLPAHAPQIAMDSSGTAVVVWFQEDGIAQRGYVHARRNSPTSGWGMTSLLSTDFSGYVSSPQVAMDPGGKAIAVWVQTEGLNETVYASRFVPDAIDESDQSNVVAIALSGIALLVATSVLLHLSLRRGRRRRRPEPVETGFGGGPRGKDE